MDEGYASLEQVLRWVAWLACVMAVSRLILIGGQLYSARKGHGDVGIENIAATLVGTIMVGAAGAFAGVLLS